MTTLIMIITILLITILMEEAEEAALPRARLNLGAKSLVSLHIHPQILIIFIPRFSSYSSPKRKKEKIIFIPRLKKICPIVLVCTAGELV